MRYVIVGNSAAGVSAAKMIHARDKKADIIMISKDAFFYSRCQLHFVCTGKKNADKIKFMSDNWCKYSGIKFLKETEVTAIDTNSAKVTTNHGETISYDKLLIATGASSKFPDIKNIVGPNVFGIRNIEDAEKINEKLKNIQRVTVIGAGLTGCEVSGELIRSGYEVSLVEITSYPLPLQLEEITGNACAELLKDKGIHLYCGECVDEIRRDSNGMPYEIALKSGKTIDTDLIICAAGVQPNIDMIKNSEIKTNTGILINEYTETSVKNVYAAGDVTETEDIILKQIMPTAIWPTAVHQGKTAGINMTGGEEKLTKNTGLKTSISLLGVNIISLGCVAKANPKWTKKIFKETDSFCRHNIKILYLDGNLLRGAVLWGNIANAGLYGEAIINRRDISSDMEFIDNLDAAKLSMEEQTATI